MYASIIIHIINIEHLCYIHYSLPWRPFFILLVFYTFLMIFFLFLQTSNSVFFTLKHFKLNSRVLFKMLMNLKRLLSSYNAQVTAKILIVNTFNLILTDTRLFLDLKKTNSFFIMIVQIKPKKFLWLLFTVRSSHCFCFNLWKP